MAKKIVFILIVILSAVVSGLPLLHPGLIPTHDGEYHVVRFFEFNKAILGGDLYPRWAPDLNNGFGVPLFNFVYPLPNYISSFFHLFGVSFIDSFRLEMFLAGVLGGLFFYLWAKQFWGQLGGLVSSVFYTFSPYHFVDVYIRGSVGEVWALALFPAFLWSFTLFIKYRQKIFFPLSSMLFALIIFSHNILALMFAIFSVFYLVFLVYRSQAKDRRYLLLTSFLILVFGLLLSSIFWLPALFEKEYVRGLEIFDISRNFPLLYQLLIPSWGSGFSGGQLQNQLSFQIGMANLLAVFSAFISLFIFKNKDDKKPFAAFFIICFIIVFFLMLKQSLPVWKASPLMNYFQFPWRLLSLEILICSFLAGSIVYVLSKHKIVSLILAFVMISISFLLGIGYAKPAYFLLRDDNYYTSRSNFIDGTNSPGDAFNTIWINSPAEKAQEKLVFLKGKGEIEIKNIKSTNYLAHVSALENSEILVNAAYFPGWSASIDNQKTKVRLTNEGLFSFSIPKGNHVVSVKFQDTLIRKIGTLAFYVCAVLLLALFVKPIFATIRR